MEVIFCSRGRTAGWPHELPSWVAASLLLLLPLAPIQGRIRGSALPLAPMYRAGGAPEWCRQAGPTHQRAVPEAVLPSSHHSPLWRDASPLQLLPHSRESLWWGEYRIEKCSNCSAVPSTSPSAWFSQTPLSGALHSRSYADSTCQPGVTGESAWSGMSLLASSAPESPTFQAWNVFHFFVVSSCIFSACFDVTAVSAHFVLSAQALKHCSYLHLFLPWNVTA